MKKRLTFPERNRQFLDDAIEENNLQSLLNDRKWVKLIGTLVENADIIKSCRIKLIWEGPEKTRELLFDKNTRYEFDYYQHSMEAMVSGSPRGWYDYREIEWLDFPQGKNEMRQDLEKIQALLKAHGAHEMALSEDNLRVFAYYRSAQPN